MSDITTIVDQVGRTVIGVETKSTKDTITLNNPVIIHVQPNTENGQLQVQSFPYLFMEFIKGDKTKNNWTFNKGAIAVSDVELDDKILEQYKNINSPAAAETSAEEPNIIKLFDE
tara:strand:- start:16301 stop:16645 length:345 start_codon:yes stop_codon:yes gene_type:complete